MELEMPEDIITQITGELSKIFRHLLPGLAILGIAGISHPSWFEEWSTHVDGWHVAIVGAIALTVGNAWYVFHRYVFHQVIDYFVSLPQRRGEKFDGYRSWLADHIDKSFQAAESRRQLGNHVHFRSAQIIFLFIIAEAIIVFSIWPQAGTFLDRCRGWTVGAGIALFLWCALIQYHIGHHIDVFVAESYGGKKAAATEPQSNKT